MWHIIGPKSACTKDRPNDVIKGIMPERFAYLRSDLQDIAIVLRSGWEEKQFKTKPVELGSDETIGDDSDHLCAQEGQFFGPKPTCSICRRSILCCRLCIYFIITNIPVQYTSFQTLHITLPPGKYSSVSDYIKSLPHPPHAVMALILDHLWRGKSFWQVETKTKLFCMRFIWH